MAIVLNNITSGYNLSKINANFQNIEDYINDKLLARAATGVAGEAMMERDLDMNGNEILNYPIDVTNPNSLVTKAYVDAGDENLQLQVDKTLRFPEAVNTMSSVSGRANSLQGYDSLGNPVPIFSMTATADLAIKLASHDEGLGGNLVGLENGLTVQDTFDASAEVSVLEFIPKDKWQYIDQDVNAAAAIAGAGDLYTYIVAADAFAYNNNKVLTFPAGQYPISSTYVQTARKVKGIPGASFLIPYTGFSTGTWLHKWPAVNGQPRMHSEGMSYDGLGLMVGGFFMSSGCHSSSIEKTFIRNCWYNGMYISPVGATRDIVNLVVDGLYILDSGSAANLASLAIDVNTATTAWTDGTISNVDISSTNSDSSNTVGPIALTINNTSKAIFNVKFDRFFTSTRLNTHIKTTSNSRLLFVGNTMSNFSGETHAYVGGVDTNGYNTSLPQVDLRAGYRNWFHMMYPHGALGNAGLMIRDGIEPVFTGWTFQPGQVQDMNGNYLDALNIVACDGATFRDCSVRNLLSTTGSAPWKSAFTSYMHDTGTNTRWDSWQMGNKVTVQHPMSYYSTLNGSSKPTNAISYGADITFAQGSNRGLIMGFPVTANATDDQTVQYALVPSAQGTEDYYYLSAKVTMTAGVVNNHYLQFQMWGTSISLVPSALGTEYTIFYRFPVGTSTTLNRLIIHIGHTATAATAPSFTIKDIVLTTDTHPYPFRYKKSAIVD